MNYPQKNAENAKNRHFSIAHFAVFRSELTWLGQETGHSDGNRPQQEF